VARLREVAESSLELVVNPGRDLERLDVDAARVDRSLVAVRAAGLRVPGAMAFGRSLLVLEHAQVTGSFKVRGAVAAISARIDEARGRGVIAASAGNHGAGVAWAARALGVRATIVVPQGTPSIKRARIEGEGAELVIEGAGYDDAERAAIDLAVTRGSLFLSPYDDLDVSAGNGGTLARDIESAIGRLSRLIVPLGGGGLASGLAAGFDRPREVWGAQSAACPAFARSLQRGFAIAAMSSDGATLAEGLEGGISAAGFERARRALSGVAIVTEESIAYAMQWARRELGLLIEGSAAVALVPLLAGHELADGAAIVLTGRNVDA
jgi:threonine dehydratase